MSPQLWPGRAQGSWQTLLELFTAPSCCLLLVHPQLQTSLRCSFHLSLPPFLTSDSEVDLHRCAGGVHLLLRVPHCLEQPGLTKLPLSPAVPSLCPALPLPVCNCQEQQVSRGTAGRCLHIGASAPEHITAHLLSSAGISQPLCTSQAATALHLSAPGVFPFPLSHPPA